MLQRWENEVCEENLKYEAFDFMQMEPIDYKTVPKKLRFYTSCPLSYRNPNRVWWTHFWEIRHDDEHGCDAIYTYRWVANNSSYRSLPYEFRAVDIDKIRTIYPLGEHYEKRIRGCKPFDCIMYLSHSNKQMFSLWEGNMIESKSTKHGILIRPVMPREKYKEPIFYDEVAWRVDIPKLEQLYGVKLLSGEK
jgi:hypothetical protein